MVKKEEAIEEEECIYLGMIDGWPLLLTMSVISGVLLVLSGGICMIISFPLNMPLLFAGMTLASVGIALLFAAYGFDSISHFDHLPYTYRNSEKEKVKTALAATLETLSKEPKPI